MIKFQRHTWDKTRVSQLKVNSTLDDDFSHCSNCIQLNRRSVLLICDIEHGRIVVCQEIVNVELNS